MTAQELAEKVEVDPKTVERWLGNGRVPHQRHRAGTAAALGAEEIVLWPQLLDDERVRSASQAEVLRVYPNRGAVPAELWHRLVDGTKSNVDVLVYAGLFLADSHPDLPTKLVDRASEGLQARLLLGDPDSDAVAMRGSEEGIGENLAARIRLSLSYLEPVIGAHGIELRQHASILYNSIFRFDDEMLVNTHVHGFPAAQNPMMHLGRIEGGRLFDHYMQSFTGVWDTATPLEGKPAA